jgi:hypothetical protein
MSRIPIAVRADADRVSGGLDDAPIYATGTVTQRDLAAS